MTYEDLPAKIPCPVCSIDNSDRGAGKWHKSTGSPCYTAKCAVFEHTKCLYCDGTGWQPKLMNGKI